MSVAWPDAPPDGSVEDRIGGFGRCRFVSQVELLCNSGMICASPAKGTRQTHDVSSPYYSVNNTYDLSHLQPLTENPWKLPFLYRRCGWVGRCTDGGRGGNQFRASR